MKIEKFRTVSVCKSNSETQCMSDKNFARDKNSELAGDEFGEVLL